ncbi:hypothetical protein [Saccharopolyspora griseoalba]|uniref:Uncharacterized protein n=1 Tax=Saccharopolyspora griseoalba TaxID=1431848 RepID=A0ABW2LST4_9PSEU
MTGDCGREAGRALCETKSGANAKHLDCAEGQREDQRSGKEVRVPNCGGCLDKATRITGMNVKNTILAVDGGRF